MQHVGAIVERQPPAMRIRVSNTSPIKRVLEVYPEAKVKLADAG
jgi:hypothetical protein